MKNYKKTYESIFTSSRSLKKCNINKVSTDINLSGDEYRKLMRKTIISFHKDIFNNLVKLFWLNRRFVYNGKPRCKKRRNGHILDTAFGVFMRKYVGLDNRMISKNKIYTKIETYLDDFFKDFDARDPFKEKMEFPYKHITLDYLIVVYQMPERLELLKYAEDNNLSYIEFLDYVINYVYNYNEENNDREYIFMMVNTFFMPYVKVIYK